MATELATLAGGCFWCLEAAFQQLRGVTKVVSGYAGGSVPNPSYQAVCTGATGHAEVTQITFDPAVISYRDLLDVSSRSTTHHAQPAGWRRGHAVPLGHLLPLARTESRGRAGDQAARGGEGVG